MSSHICLYIHIYIHTHTHAHTHTHTHIYYMWASKVSQLVKNLSTMQETLVRFLVRKIPWRRDRLPNPVFLGFLGGSDGNKSACRIDPWVGKISWRRACQPITIFLPEESPWSEKPDQLQSMGS